MRFFFEWIWFLTLASGHCRVHTLLWRGSDGVGNRLDTDHHACHVHHVSEHHGIIGNNGISEDDWLLAYLLSPYPIGYLFPRDLLVSSEEKGRGRNQSLGFHWKTPLAYQEENAAVGDPCSDNPLYLLLLHNSFSTCLHVTLI